MISVHWVDPVSLNPTNRFTGTLRVEAPGIEINIELFGHQISYDWREYIPRSLHVLNTLANNLEFEALSEPEPELLVIPDTLEPELEPELIPFAEFQ